MINVTEQYKYRGAIKAERDEANVLILFALDEPRRPLDGKLCHYELCHEWLSSPDADSCQVRGSDYSLWTKKEGKEMLANGLFASVDVI